LEQELILRNDSDKSLAIVGTIITMKKILLRILAVLTLVLILGSCKKTYPSGVITYPSAERKIRFQLYTNQDFSADTHVINFSLFIRNANATIFDSSLVSMQIKDIPDEAHKLVIEKAVPGNDNSDLAAGFRYEIHDVGISWHTDTSKAGNLLKIIDYNFQ